MLVSRKHFYVRTKSIIPFRFIQKVIGKQKLDIEVLLNKVKYKEKQEKLWSFKCLQIIFDTEDMVQHFLAVEIFIEN